MVGDPIGVPLEYTTDSDGNWYYGSMYHAEISITKLGPNAFMLAFVEGETGRNELITIIGNVDGSTKVSWDGTMDTTESTLQNLSEGHNLYDMFRTMDTTPDQLVTWDEWEVYYTNTLADTFNSLFIPVPGTSETAYQAAVTTWFDNFDADGTTGVSLAEFIQGYADENHALSGAAAHPLVAATSYGIALFYTNAATFSG